MVLSAPDTTRLNTAALQCAMAAIGRSVMAMPAAVRISPRRLVSRRADRLEPYAGSSAAVAALQILVWNPLAAVPGASLAEISGHLDDTGEAFSPWSVLATLLVGPVLALALVVIAALGRLSAVWCAAAVCAVIAAGALGYGADSALVLGGWLDFPEHARLGWLTALWMVGLWVGFAATLRHSFRLVLGRPLVAALLGASGGPFSYFAGERLGARAMILETTSKGQPLSLRVRQHRVLVHCLLSDLGMGPCGADVLVPLSRRQ